jgi:hypothetical protein
MFIEHKADFDGKWYRTQLVMRQYRPEPVYGWRMIGVDGRLAMVHEPAFANPIKAMLWAMRYRGGSASIWRHLDTSKMQPSDWLVRGEVTERKRVITSAINYKLGRRPGRPRKRIA